MHAAVRTRVGTTLSGSRIDFNKFDEVTYESFRRRALDDSLSANEKVGFPDAYREGKEQLIFADIMSKLSQLREHRRLVVDIGAGCGPLAVTMMEHCERRDHRLVQVDSPEMLALLPPATPTTTRVRGRFPDECGELIADVRDRVDCVLAYGVLSCVFADGNVFQFVDQSLELLAPGGQLLLADLPNVSKRKRFFASDAGVRFHQRFMGTATPPEANFNTLEPGALDDAVVLAVVGRCRAAGFDAYVVPQGDGLPFANRREDILVTRP